MQIQQATKADFITLIQVWEASVLATHDFLPKAMIETLRPQILNDYLPNLTVYKALDEQHNIVGFISTGVVSRKRPKFWGVYYQLIKGM